MKFVTDTIQSHSLSFALRLGPVFTIYVLW